MKRSEKTMRRDWKLFSDQVTDIEDVLQGMATECREAGEDDAALAALVAAAHRLVLEQVMVRLGNQVPVPAVICR